MGMSITGINQITKTEVDCLLEDFPDIFDCTLGQYAGIPISFNLNSQIAPIHLKPQRVPFTLKPKTS